MVVYQGDSVIGQPQMNLVCIRAIEFCHRWELGRHSMQSMRANPYSSYSSQRRERRPQNMFDVVMQKFDRSRLGVDIRYGHGFAQDAQGLTSRILDATMDSMFMVWSRYLTGCDGAKSSEREQFGTSLHGCGVLSLETMANAGHDPMHETPPALDASLCAFLLAPAATGADKGTQCTL
jgi:hypothetical protein